MRCDWRNDRTAPTVRGVVNLDTGESLSPCAMADEETGEYERYVVVERSLDGRPLRLATDPATGMVLTERGRCRLQIIPL